MTRKRARVEEPLRKDVHKAVADLGMVGCTDVDKIKEKVTVVVDVLKRASKEDVETGKVSFVKCAVGVPGGCRAFATCLRVLGTEDEDIAKDIVAKVRNRLERATAHHEWHAVKALYRLLGLLHRYSACKISTSDISNIIKQANSATLLSRGDSIVYVVLSSLPYFGNDVFSAVKDDLAKYFEKREKSQTLLPLRPIQVQQYNFIQDEKTKVATQPDMLETMYKELAGEDFEVPAIFDAVEWADKDLAWCAGDVPLPTFPEHADGVVYADIPVSLNIFYTWSNDQPVRVPLKPASEGDNTFNPADVLPFDERDAVPLVMRTIGRELATDTIRCFHSDIDLLSTALSHLLCIKTFSLAAVESLLNGAFTLPHPPLPLAFYTSLLIRLCQDNTSPYLLPTAEAFDTLYELLPNLDPELTVRFQSLLAGFVSSFSYKWQWEEQEKDSDHRTGTCKRLFNTELLHHMLRSASKKVVSEFVPRSFDKQGILLEENVTRYKYAQPREFKKDADRLLERLAGESCSVEEVVEMVDSMNEAGKDAGEVEKADALVNCLLFIGSDSVAHERIMFHKYAQAIKQTVHNGCHVIAAAAEFWESDPHHIVMTISNLLQLDIVSFLDVVTWSFSNEIAEMYERSFIWEVIYMAIDTLAEKVFRSYEDIIDFKGCVVELEGQDYPQQDKEKAKRQIEKKIAKMETMLYQTHLVEMRTGFKTLFEGVVKKIKAYYRRDRKTSSELLQNGDEAQIRRNAAKNFVWCRSALGHLNAIGRRYLPYMLPFIDELYEDVFTKGPPVVMNIFLKWSQIRGRRHLPSKGAPLLYVDSDPMQQEVMAHLTTTGVGGTRVHENIFTRLDEKTMDLATLLPKEEEEESDEEVIQNHTSDDSDSSED